MGRWADMVDRLIWAGLFEGRFEDRDFAIERFGSWTAEVIASVPPERLLVFEVADGWGPLCEFLDVLEPDMPFPRVNDRATMRRRFRRVRYLTRGVPVAVATLGAAGAALFVRRRLRLRPGTPPPR